MNKNDRFSGFLLMLFGVGIYAFCVYLSFAFSRVAQICVEAGGIVTIGAIVAAIPIFLPWFLLWKSEEKYLNKRPRLKIWMYILCSVHVAAFIAYCIFVDADLIRGRDMTLDCFLALYLFIMPIVYAVRAIRS